MGSYFNPVKIHIDSLERIGTTIQTLSPQGSGVLLLTRGGDFSTSEARKTIERGLSSFAVHELEVQISNPDIEDLFSFIAETESFDYQCVLGVGGGSVLDLAKSLAVLKGMKIDSVSALRKIITEKQYESNDKSVPWVAVPTTAGTGSEVTCWATVWDRANGVKLSLDSPKMYADAAIVDSALTVSLPKGLTAATALDALCHATEAYWSKHSNEISQVYALEAISRIVGNFEKVLQNPEDVNVRKEIALGSLYAGLAFSNTKTTACHSISYPLTLQIGMVHGIAASITLAKVLEMNFSAMEDGKRLLRAFGVESVQEVQILLERFFSTAGFSNRLRDYGADEANLETIAANAFTKGRMDNNPVALTEEMVKEILLSIY